MLHRFIPINLGAPATQHRKTIPCPHRLAVVDADAVSTVPRVLWKALRRSEPFVYTAKRGRQFLYESIIGPRPDGQVILYMNGDPLDCRKKNLQYIVPNKNTVMFTTPNETVKELPGFEQAYAASYTDAAQNKKDWSSERGWRIAAGQKSILSKQAVVALLDFYTSSFSEAELERSAKHKRAGDSFEGCLGFLNAEFEIKPANLPSVRQLRRILRGESLYLPELADHYRKAKMLLPCARGILKPEPKTMFKFIQTETK